jgi:hypothetical protein
VRGGKRLGRVREMERLEKEGRKVEGGMEWLVDEGTRGKG